MTIKEYAEAIASKIDGAETVEVEKDNQVKYIGITVPKISAASATIYIDELYRDEKSIDFAVDFVSEQLKHHSSVKFDVDMIKDKYWALNAVKVTLNNESTKSDVKMSAKKWGFDDLILIPRLVFELNGSRATIKIEKNHLKMWGITEQELFDRAIENTFSNDGIIKDLIEILRELNSLIPIDESMSGMMLCVSNKDKIRGAVQILNPVIIEKLKAIFPEGYTVLPSSVHEVLVVSKKLGDNGDCSSLVSFVNNTEVDPQEVLSNKVYTFD